MLSNKSIKEFYEKKFMLLEGFLKPQDVAKYLLSTSKLDKKRVTCGFDNISWLEQEINEDEPICRELFNDSKTLNLLYELLGLNSNKTLKSICWTSCYLESEFINRHIDSNGDIQLLLCLKNVKKENGGTLKLEHENNISYMHLKAGDLLIFKATQIFHSTSPLLKSFACPFPERIVCVARYYIE